MKMCSKSVGRKNRQLTWGGPQVLYNGGLQQVRVRYYDAQRRRPGLPAGVAALVSCIEPHATVVELINLDPGQDRTVIVQSGAFAEHSIEHVGYTACTDASWIGGLYDYGHGTPVISDREADVDGPWLTVRLPASTRIRLTLRLIMHCRRPSYVTPFDDASQAKRPC
jgi:hypothetical protein